MNVREQFSYGFWGQVLGDVCGAITEFTNKDDLKTPIKTIRSPLIHNIPTGCWTDDTSQLLCMMDSLVICKGFDWFHQIHLYLNWYRKNHYSPINRIIDIGVRTREALAFYEKHNRFLMDRSPTSAGNAPLIRILPIVAWYRKSPYITIKYAMRSSIPTHSHSDCIQSCRVLASMFLYLFEGEKDKEKIFKTDFLTKSYWNDTIGNLYDVVTGKKTFSLENPTPYVVSTLYCAYKTFYDTNSFEQGLWQIVNNCGDADSVGAVYGALAGLYYKDVPSRLKIQIYKKTYLQNRLNTFLSSLNG